MSLLSRLIDLVFPPRDSELVARTESLESLGELLAPRLVESAGITCTALLPYRDRRIRALVREAKFKDNRRAQALLGHALAAYLSDWLPDAQAFEASRIVLVPVPLSPARKRSRGYNQAERIVSAALTQIPELSMDERLLARVRETPSQTTLGRVARLKNMENAFHVIGTIDPSATYIVIDDVVTTGATLFAAHQALVDAGATHMNAVATAY